MKRVRAISSMVSLVVAVAAVLLPSSAHAGWVKTKNASGFTPDEVACSNPDASGNVYCVKFGVSSTSGAVAKISADGATVAIDAGPACTYGNFQYQGVGMSAAGDVLRVGCGGGDGAQYDERVATCTVSSFGSCSWQTAFTSAVGGCFSVAIGCGVTGALDDWNGSAPAWMAFENGEYIRLRNASTELHGTRYYQNKGTSGWATPVGSYFVGAWGTTYQNNGFSYFILNSSYVNTLNSYTNSGFAAYPGRGRKAIVVGTTHVVFVSYTSPNTFVMSLAAATGNIGSWQLSGDYRPGAITSRFTGTTREYLMKADGTCLESNASPPTSTWAAQAACALSPDGGESVRAMFAIGTGASATVGVLTSGGDIFEWQTPAPVVTISANPTSAAVGASTTITWSVTDATSCTASGAWSGSKNATSGSESVTVSAEGTNTYTLTCTGAGGSGNNSTAVTGLALSSSVSSPPYGSSLRQGVYR